jgi:twinkle protein
LESAYLPQLEDEAPCLVFPYVRRGETVNLKYRSVEGKHFRQVKDAEKVLYGLDDLTGDSAVIVEGECDKLALATAGILQAVSVPDGAPPPNSKPSETKFEYLVTCAEYLEPLKKIILAVDDDASGHTLEAELARRLGPERCFRVRWPESCKDANEVLLQHGADELRRCISEAKPVPLEGIQEVVDLASDVMTLYQEGLRGGVTTGWAMLDPLYTVRPGELTIVTGIPSHGKSQFLDALAVNLAKAHDWTMALCSPENLPIARHVAKLTEQYTGQPFRQGLAPRMSPSELAHALQWLQTHFVFVAPEEALTQTETEYISTSLGQIRRFARIHGVHVWVVAHPMKLIRKEDGSYPVPTPYDISGSAHWRNKADNCLTVWRNEQDAEQPSSIFIQKIRFREVGSLGMAELRFNKLNGRYEEDRPALWQPLQGVNL